MSEITLKTRNWDDGNKFIYTGLLGKYSADGFNANLYTELTTNTWPKPSLFWRWKIKKGTQRSCYANLEIYRHKGWDYSTKDFFLASWRGLELGAKVAAKVTVEGITTVVTEVAKVAVDYILTPLWNFIKGTLIYTAGCLVVFIVILVLLGLPLLFQLIC